MDKEVLEVVLKRLVRESNIQRVLDVETESPLPTGENYSSTILRSKMTVVLGNGRVTKRSIIIKTASTANIMKKVKRDYDVYQMEARIYSEIFKEMEFLMEEFEDHDEPLWCKFIFYDPQESSLGLEDLKAIGFSLVPRQLGLDLVHAKLVLRGLGRFHGMAKILEERGVISKRVYKPFFLLTDDYYIKLICHNGIKGTAKGIRASWGPEWASLADKISVPLEVFLKKIKDCATPDEGTFTCLNHGDCWSNNMMFKYDWQNRPVTVKFLDYQMPHHNTPCVDVTYFIYLSIQPKVRRQNYKLLLECYHDSLTKTLDKYGYMGTKPTLEEIEKVMERLSFVGLSFFAAFYSIMTCKSMSVIDFEKREETDGDEGLNLEIFEEEGMLERLEADLKVFAEKLRVV